MSEKFSFNGHAKVISVSRLSPDAKQYLGLNRRAGYSQVTLDSAVGQDKSGLMVVPSIFISSGEPSLVVPQNYEQGIGAKVSFEEFDLEGCCSEEGNDSMSPGWLKLPQELSRNPRLVYISDFSVSSRVSPIYSRSNLSSGVHLKRINNSCLDAISFSLRLDSGDTLVELIERQMQGLNSYMITGVQAEENYFTLPF